MSAYTYILANYSRSLFYVGATEDIDKRKVEHKEGTGSYYSREHHMTHLVYFEQFEFLVDAIVREKEITKMSHEEQMELVKSANPRMEDLCQDPKIQLGL